MLLKLPTRLLLAALLLLAILALTACAKDIPVYTPPSERPVAAAEKPWAPGNFLALAYHDVEDDDPDQAFLSVRTDRLVDQLAWLRENGYQAVSVDQILAARQGGKPLPERAVLLSFDDGYRSFYTRVLPILKAYRWPALLAPVGTWMDTPANKPVDFGGSLEPRRRFLDWDEIRLISQSGLVEIAAHTDASHYGALANPQGNTEPAAAIRAYDAKTGNYETEAQFQARMGGDVRAISRKIEQVTGRKPRVWVWPYGAEGGSTLRIAADNGYELALTLEDGPGRLDRLMSTPRMLLASDPPLKPFANSIVSMEATPSMRVAHVDLDYVYDPDPAQTDRNLGELVQRILDLQINTVFLQAYSDPTGDGLVRSVYFPNRWLPVRADLFNRAAWQLHNRANVMVYAWMPVLAYDLDASIPRVTRWQPGQAEARPDPDQYRRLSPFDATARARIGDLYEDLARHAIFDGILFHDDAVLSDFEDASPGALAAYRAAGLPADIGQLRTDATALDPLQEPLPDRFHRGADRTGACGARAADQDRPQPLRHADPGAAVRDLVRAEPGRFPGRLRLDRPHGHAADGERAQGPGKRLARPAGRRRGAAPRRARQDRVRTAGARLAHRPRPPRGHARRHRGAGRLDAAPATARRAQLRLLPRRFLARPAPVARHPARHLRSLVSPPMIDRLIALIILLAVLGAPFGFTMMLTGQALLGFVFFYPLFMSGMWMAGGLYFWWHWERRWQWGPGSTPPALAGDPLVSILVPCYNEADNGEETLLAALNQRYPNVEVIAINDGSSDGTGPMLDRLAEQHPRLRVVHLAQNQGKAMALRMGALAARSEYLVCIDGDAVLDPDAAAYLVAPLIDNPRVGAVTGNPRIRTRSTLIGRIQVGEFSSIIGLIKRTQRVYGQVFTVSGVVAAFRRAALDRVGYWSLDMITEDIDISWKLQRDHWSIFYEPRGLCWILMPETLRGIWKQRLRWAQGGAEVFLKNLRSIWSWRHRRLWPLMLEFCLSTAWAFAFGVSVLLWLISQVVTLPNNMHIASLMPPAFTGMMLAVVCLLQFAISILIDRRYEPGLWRALYWVIWYPLAYWMVSLFTTLVSFPKVMLRKQAERARWTSPDRGIKSPDAS